jgi:protein-S-isoprenylcysteine O-methyltransferase Ste14
MAFGKTAKQRVADETQKASERAAEDQERARGESLASPIGQVTTVKEQSQGLFEANGDRMSPEPVNGSRIDLGRLVGAPVMVCLLVLNALPLFGDANPRGSWSTAATLATRLLTICFYAFIIAIYLRRSPAVATSASRPATAAALLATYLPFSLGLVNSGTPLLLVLVAANALLILGLGFSLWSLRSLNRSFSIIAQARAVVRRGPYRIVRHPLYTGELAAALGVVLLKPGWATFAIWVSLCGLQAYRARHEEAILLATLPDYAEYQRQTPQLLPLSLSRAFRKRTANANQP